MPRSRSRGSRGSSPRMGRMGRSPVQATRPMTTTPMSPSRSSGGLFSGIGSTIAHGMAFGAGSQVAHQAVRNIMGANYQPVYYQQGQNSQEANLQKQPPCNPEVN